MATETTLSEKTLEDIEKAAQILSAGGLVAVPTETVFQECFRGKVPVIYYRFKSNMVKNAGK